MNAEVKKLWIDALRSGDYKQGLYQLYTPETNSYCCLGVLCSLYKKQTGSPFSVTDLSKDGEGTFLGGRVRDWAGLYENNPKVNYQNARPPLSGLNDGTLDENGRPINQLSFAEIANLIEEQF